MKMSNSEKVSELSVKKYLAIVIVQEGDMDDLMDIAEQYQILPAMDDEELERAYNRLKAIPLEALVEE